MSEENKTVEAAKPLTHEEILRNQKQYNTLPGIQLVNNAWTTGKRNRAGGIWGCAKYQDALVECLQNAVLTADECWLKRQQHLLCVRGGTPAQIKALDPEVEERMIAEHNALVSSTDFQEWLQHKETPTKPQ
jgi:hypothetical protein